MTFSVISPPTCIMKILGFIMMMMITGSVFSEAGVYNVLNYGATSYNKGDSSNAFLKAWNLACAESGKPTILIPEKWTFLVYPVNFQGPCKAKNVVFMLSGTIVAPELPSVWKGRDTSKWLIFGGVNGLIVDGYGVIDGRGKGWWDQSCKHNTWKGCTSLAPTAISFHGCNDSTVKNIHITNSAQVHMYLGRLRDFGVDNIKIQAPWWTPNTDGIHIQASSNLGISNSVIGSGDDCISVGDYTSNVWISKISCGPGHGISIGSLGKDSNFVQVSGIHVSDSYFDRTTNGARIKTWQVGRGYAQDITFKNLQFYKVRNPIIIDQNYCDVRNDCKEQVTGVKIRNVTYSTLYGTSDTDIAINLKCSKSVPCSEIWMDNIHLANAVTGKQVTASCYNAYGREFDVVPGHCLLKSAPTTSGL
ncbi:OLC1v1037086C1 [Oldenlandia corymbosa var. corymbosa]|uniref:OLC1v1037086C1 n=1 Tax=Oldenlandia corymbosa var. corymbosa TaxID=529605 RepID=A0AAV1CY81_OLDCO|nr:OLC1v1037086C1 [Oldenlandia corymbosa var. corymbosa]